MTSMESRLEPNQSLHALIGHLTTFPILLFLLSGQQLYNLKILYLIHILF